MDDQQKKDFAKILEQFPASKFDGEGYPVISKIIRDAEDDHIKISFDSDGIATIEGAIQTFTYLSLRPDHLADITSASAKAIQLYKSWEASPSGKAWAEANGF